MAVLLEAADGSMVREKMATRPAAYPISCREARISSSFRGEVLRAGGRCTRQPGTPTRQPCGA